MSPCRTKAALQRLPLVGKLFQDITPDEVKALWAHMQAQYGSSVILKSDSTGMTLIGLLLEKLKIQDRETFLKQYTTTIGHRIYTPFEVGVPGAGYDLWWQVVICIHEHQHIHQWDESHAGLEFSWDYVTNSARRAYYEALAYTCNLELDWWRWKVIKTTPAQYAAGLKSYGCTDADVQSAQKQMELALVTVKAGGVVSHATKIGLDWLNLNVPRLRAA